MNLLNHLSWASYWEAVIVLLAVYYAFVGIRFYAAEIKGLLGRPALRNSASPGLPDQLVYPGQETAANGLPDEVSYSEDHYPDEDILEADELTISVKALIVAATGKPYAPDQLIPQIKAVFKKHDGLKNSPYRPAINELVVTECERTGVAELTEDEVDEWWSS
jgi:hypothetical protein